MMIRSTESTISELFRTESGRVLAIVVRLVKDFDLAEEAVQEAFFAASRQWPTDGVPSNPVAWLVSSARFNAIDTIRRRTKLQEREPELAQRIVEIQAANREMTEREIQDDQLRMIFACCHPAIDSQVQVALTLREVCGLTTEEIASAFLVAPATMAQRIVRGKAKIRDAGIPFQIPSLEELPDRIESVLAVCYLVFNEGYSASSGDNHTRVELSGEAIRLGRLLCELLPEAEVFGLLALMLLHESRRDARTTLEGDVILLEEQDRSRWNREFIDEAQPLLARAYATGEIGAYTIQAAISAEHVRAMSAAETNWGQIVTWYDLLLQAAPSPVVELNRAVAIAMQHGPETGLKLIEALQQQKELADYHLFHAARADLLRRLGRSSAAVEAYQAALACSQQEPERRYLVKRIREMS